MCFLWLQLSFILPCSLPIFVKNEERNQITKFSFSTLPNFQIYAIYKAQLLNDKSFFTPFKDQNLEATEIVLFCFV